MTDSSETADLEAWIMPDAPGGFVLTFTIRFCAVDWQLYAKPGGGFWGRQFDLNPAYWER
jgi:hypothetical protein